VLPTATVPKFKVVGETVADPPGIVPVPVSGTACDPPRL
jgi:hypothetical protein